MLASIAGRNSSGVEGRRDQRDLHTCTPAATSRSASSAVSALLAQLRYSARHDRASESQLYPRARSRPRRIELRPLLLLAPEGVDGRCDRTDVGRIEHERRARSKLGKRRRVRARNRRAGGERLQHREAEALEEGREDEQPCSTQQRGELGRRDVAGEGEVRVDAQVAGEATHGRGVGVGLSRADDGNRDSVPLEHRDGLDEAEVVLVRPRLCGVQARRGTRSQVPRRRARPTFAGHARDDHGDLLRRDVVGVDELPLREVGRDDDVVHPRHASEYRRSRRVITSGTKNSGKLRCCKSHGW